MVHTFGRKGDYDPGSVPAFQEHLGDAGNIEECSYVVKYADEHGREGQFDPWSVRQMGIYMQTNITSDQRTIVVINPARRFQRRLLDAVRDAVPKMSDVQILLLSTAARNWRRYLDHLEIRINEANLKATLSSIEASGNTSTGSNFEVSPSDLQHLHYLDHKLHVASRALFIDTQIVKTIKDRENHSGRVGNNAIDFSYVAAMHMLHSGLQWEADRAKSLMERLKGTSNLVRIILDFKSAAATQNSSEKATEMTRLAREDNVLMLQLTRKSRRDSRTLKVITILTLFYLPASFVSTLLGMGYIHVTRSHPWKLQVQGEFLAFVVLTFFFLLITVGAWAAFEYRHGKKDDSGIVEKGRHCV